MEKYITTLELTSTCIRLLVGYVYSSQVYVLHALESDRAHLVNRHIVDTDEMALAIKELVHSASSTLGITIDSVVLGLPSTDMKIQAAKADTNTTDMNAMVQLFDGSNLISMIAKQCTLAEGKQCVIGVVPYEYSLEGSNKVYKRFPIGKRANSISMKADVEIGDALIVKTYREAVNKAGLKILMMVNVTNATTAYASFFQKAKQEYILVDIGEEYTTLGYSYDERLFQAAEFPFGRKSVVRHLMQKLSLNEAKAEEYLRIYGISQDPDFEFATQEGIKVSTIADTVKDALKPLIEQIEQFYLSFSSSARNLFVLSGVGSSIFGLGGFLSERFKNTVSVFTPIAFGARNPEYTHCLAMLKYYSDYPIKQSPNRPTDLTLTRIDLNLNAVQNPKKEKGGEEEKKPARNPFGDGDEIL